MQTALIGIEIGGTNIQGVAVVDGTISARGKIATRARQGAATVIADLVELVHKLAAGKKIQAVGLGIPGLLDAERGICISSCNLGWQEVHISRELSRRIDSPVLIDNDARVAALGEWSQGQAQNCRDFIFLTIGTGIGAGIVNDGHLLRVPAGRREAGHMIRDPRSECACNKGCLEALAQHHCPPGRAAAAANPSSLRRRATTSMLQWSCRCLPGTGPPLVVATAMTWLTCGQFSKPLNPRLR